jgi:acetaldehyde dehydrogenase/alcohol dehydrogenase
VYFKIETIQNIESLERALNRIRSAQQLFATFNQEQVDRIFFMAAKAAAKERIPLAKMAATETGMGVAEDKVIFLVIRSATPSEGASPPCPQSVFALMRHSFLYLFYHSFGLPCGGVILKFSPEGSIK